MNQRLIAIVIFILTVFPVFSQQIPDSTVIVTDSVPVHSPKKAMIFSAVIPGAGQIYNHLAMPKGQKKAFWKVPIIYAGLGTMTYLLINNQHNVTSLKAEYTNRLNGLDPSTQWALYDDASVLLLYDQYQSWRDWSILGLILVYGIQIADAGVEAHFVNFDLSKDLSLNIHPACVGFNTVGIGFRLSFH